MSSRNINTSSNQQKPKAGPRLRDASIAQLARAGFARIQELRSIASHDQQVGFPNLLAEHLLGLVTSGTTSVEYVLQQMCQFASQQDMNSAVWWHLTHWNPNRLHPMPDSVYKFTPVGEKGQEQEYVENDKFDPEFARLYFSSSTGDGCRVDDAHLNNILCMLTRKVSTFYETVLFRDVKPSDRKVTNFRLGERITDEQTGKSYYRQVDDHAGSLQAMALTTLCAQYLEATSTFDYKSLAAHLQTLLRTKEVQTKFIDACKSFNHQQRQLGRQTTLASATTNSVVAQELARVQGMPRPVPLSHRPTAPPATNAWTSRTGHTTTTTPTSTTVVPSTSVDEEQEVSVDEDTQVDSESTQVTMSNQSDDQDETHDGEWITPNTNRTNPLPSHTTDKPARGRGGYRGRGQRPNSKRQ